MGGTDQAIKTVFKGAAFVFLGVFFSKFATYLYRILMARWLGPDQYGLFSLAFSVFMIGMLFTKIGIPAGVTRFVSKYRGKEDAARIRGTIFSGLEITLPLGFVAGAVLFFASPFIATQVFHEPGVAPVLRIFAVTLPIRTFVKNVMQVFKAFQRMDYFTLVEHVVQSIVLVLITAALIYTGHGVIGAAAAYALSMVVAAVFGFYLLQTRIFPLIGADHAVVRERRELLWFSLPLLGSSMVGVISGQIDTIMLGFFSNTSAADVGVYNAAMPTGRLISAFGMAFGTILFPVITEHLARGEEESAVSIASITMRWTVAVAFPVTLLLTVFSGTILRALFGQAYMAGSFVLAIMAGAALLNATVNPLTKFLKAKDMTQWIFVNSVITTVLNVPLNVALIPVYGIAGAGIATVAAGVLGSLLATVEVVGLLRIRPSLRGLHVPVISSLVSGSGVYLAAKYLLGIIPFWVLIPAGIVFVVLYATLFLLMGGLRREDVVVLNALEERVGMNLQPWKRLVSKLAGE